MITLLLERYEPWWVIAAVVLVSGLLAFRHTGLLRTLRQTIIATLLIIALGYVAVGFIETDRKSLKQSLASVIAAVEADNATDALCHIAPSAASLRHKLDELMSMVTIAGINTLDLHFSVDRTVSPPTATLDFTAFVFWQPKERLNRDMIRELSFDLGDRDRLHRADVVLTLERTEKRERRWLITAATANDADIPVPR